MSKNKFKLETLVCLEHIMPSKLAKETIFYGENHKIIGDFHIGEFNFKKKPTKEQLKKVFKEIKQKYISRGKRHVFIAVINSKEFKYIDYDSNVSMVSNGKTYVYLHEFLAEEGFYVEIDKKTKCLTKVCQPIPSYN